MYIKQAFKGYNEWWRYLTTLIAIILAQIIGAIPLQIVVLKSSLSGSNTKEFLQSFNPEVIGISQNQGLILLMIPMVLTFFTLVLCMRYIHGHSLKNVFTSASHFRWKNFFFAFFVWGLILTIAEIVYYQLHPENYVFEFNPKEFFTLLIIALLLIPLQAGAEELYLRGNLFQGLGILSRSRIFTLIATSIAFGLMHFNNPEVEKFGTGISMSYYIGFGLFMGLLVLFDGGLEMPIAIHAINNIYGSVFVGYEGSVLQTPSLFKVIDYNSVVMLVLFVMVASIYLILSKRVFKWKEFSRILKPIEKDPEVPEELQ